MRRSVKKTDDKADEFENREEDGDEEVSTPSTPASHGTKTKRRSKGKVAGPRSKRRKVEEEEDDDAESKEVEQDEGTNSENEEQETGSVKKSKADKGKKTADNNEEVEEKSEVSGDEEDLPLSKKMKAVKKSPAKNGLTKGKRRAAELEEKLEYEVESVVGCRVQRGKRQFRIRWKGFKEEDDTWENEDGLDCSEAIEQYLQDHPQEDTEVKGTKNPKSAKKTKAAVKQEKNEDGSESEPERTEEYEVEQIKDVFIKKTGKREFLIRWKGFAAKDDTWEPEEHLNCGDLIKKFEEKVDKAKSVVAKELRVSRKPTDRFTLNMASQGRRLSRRGGGKQRVRYDDAE